MWRRTWQAFAYNVDGRWDECTRDLPAMKLEKLKEFEMYKFPEEETLKDKWVWATWNQIFNSASWHVDEQEGKKVIAMYMATNTLLRSHMESRSFYGMQGHAWQWRCSYYTFVLCWIWNRDMMKAFECQIRVEVLHGDWSWMLPKIRSQNVFEHNAPDSFERVFLVSGNHISICIFPRWTSLFTTRWNKERC